MIIQYSNKLRGQEHITNNFKVAEFMCKDGTDNILVNIDLVLILQKLRDKYGAIKVVCGYRTEQYNLKCGGATKSLHLSGNAIDFTPINCKGNKTEQLIEIARLLENDYNIKGIGLYTNRPVEFIHFDSRENKTFWLNNNTQQEYIKTFNNIDYV